MGLYDLKNIPREQAREILSSVDGQHVRIYAQDKTREGVEGASTRAPREPWIIRIAHARQQAQS